MKKVIYITVPIVLLSLLSFTLIHFNQKLKEKDLELSKIQQQIEQIEETKTEPDKLIDDVTEVEETNFEKDITEATSPIDPVTVQEIQPLETEITKTPVYISMMNGTYTCDDLGVSAINQANSYAESQQDSYNNCFEKTKRDIDAQVSVCSTNCTYACTGIGRTDTDICLDECFNNCKEQLRYDDCKSELPNLSSLRSLIEQYCE